VLADLYAGMREKIDPLLHRRSTSTSSAISGAQGYILKDVPLKMDAIRSVCGEHPDIKKEEDDTTFEGIA